MPFTLTLYRRPGCTLCDDAEGLLDDALGAWQPVGAERPLIERVDISADAVLEARYGTRIPVIAVGDDELDLVTSTSRIRRLLERSDPMASTAG